MDWTVFFGLMFLLTVLIFGAIGFGVRAKKHWSALVGCILCACAALFVSYGLATQCEGYAVYVKC